MDSCRFALWKKAIGTKWVYRNKKDERGVVVRNKARIEAIMIFLAFASYMGFKVYQMDVKSAVRIYCLSSGKSLTVAKLLSSVNISSGKIYTNSGKLL
ncbi:hypothetical protein Tco_0054792 [Tanacetum coccineum]